ncbi:MAG: carbohydrate binding domain-containing protein [Lachnospiraceae bacterium]|nr:carbohydrate binding domain-containing protein [Candidatus Colinaster scatohippi]
MKKMRAIAVIMAAIMAVPTMPAGLVYAEEADIQIEEVAEPGVANFDPTEQGYSLKWEDNFDGDSLNSDAWNVELHEKGWVNDEWQEYIDDSKVLEVSDGTLKIKPVKETERKAIEKSNLLKNAGFTKDLENWVETIANWGPDYVTDASHAFVENGIKYSIKNPGTDDWHVQLKQTVSLKAGKTYVVSFKAMSTESRSIIAGVQNASYAQYKQAFPELKANEEQEVSYSFTANADDSTACLYFSLGQPVGKTIPASDVTITDISLKIADEETDVAEINEDEELVVAETKESENLLAGAEVFPFEVAVINGDNMGAKAWDLQKAAYGINLKSGSTYKFRFTASATADRTIVAGMQMSTSPWSGYLNKEVELTSEAKEFEFEYTASVDDSSAMLFFNIGTMMESDGATAKETPDATISVTNVELVELIEESDTEDSGEKDTEEEETSDEEVEYEEVDSYYSGRISTQNKKAYTYGYFECKAKVPEGQGYLPAFWLMANDENLYGQWPQCGEIDCMEIWGSKTKEVLGTIHYGKPHQESQGKYTLADDAASFSDDYHVFGCEWVPGRITWYVDGIKFHEAQNWYTKNENDTVPVSYPAPFDQDFYIILNLAIGNNWAGRPDETTVYDGNNFEIDYVKVYQKDSYGDDVDEPEVPFNPRHEADENGNYIINGNFAEAEALDDSAAWVYMTANGGEGTAAINTTDKQIDVNISEAGTVDYSIQLVQAELPFEKGAEYEVSFKAWADKARTMNVDIKAPDHGYQSYMPTFNPELTTTPTTFTTTFKMKDASDDNGRLEFNMGAAETGAIHITDVAVKKTQDADPNEKEVKTVTSDGNYIYNGSFSQGKGGVLEWTVSPDDKSKVSVTGVNDGRRLAIAKGTDAQIEQTDLAFTDGVQYLYSMEVDAAAAVDVKVNIGGINNVIKAIKGKNTYSFVLPATNKYTNKNVVVAVKAPTGSDVKIDNLRLEEDMLLKNGSFTAGLSSYSPYVDSSASGSYVVDSLKNDNALAFTINNTGDQDWKIQLKQENIKLEQGKAYRLKFKAKTDLEGGRNIRVIMQGGKPLDWPVYSGDDKGIYRIGADWTEFTNVFRMNQATDPAAFLSVCMGKIDEQITTKHDVVLDDFSLEEIDLPVYSVTFDGNGEEFAEAPAVQYVDNDTCANEPAAVSSTNEAATFSGWYIDSECTTPFDFGAPIVKDTIVYAGWNLTEEALDGSIKIAAIEDQTYTGKAIKPAVVITQYGKELVLNKDYKVAYSNNINVNKNGLLVTNNDIDVDEETGVVSYNYNKILPTITVTGIADFADTIKINFNILPYNLADTNNDVRIETADVIAANDKKDTAITYKVYANGKYIANKTDYTAVLVTKAAKDASGEDVEAETECPNFKIPKGYTGTFEIKVTGTAGDDKVAGNKNYSGNVEKEITVDPVKKPISNATVTFAKLDTTGEAMTDEALKAVTTVKVAGKKLTAEDFDVEFVADSVVNVGTYQVLVTGKGDYAGTKLATVKLTGIDIRKATITIGSAKVYDRTASGVNALSVKYDGEELEEDTDYTVTVTGDVNVGTAKVVIAGIGKFTGTVNKTYRINAFKLANDAEGLTYSKDLGNVEYVAKGVTPDVNISYQGARLVNGVDYTLSYSKNAALGTAKVTVKGKGNFSGSITDITFNIVPGDIKKAGTVITVNDVVYNSKPGKYMSTPKLTTATGKALAANTDYNKTFKYELINEDGNTEVLDAKSAPAAGSTIRVTVYGGKNYTGLITATYRVASKSIASATIKINDKEYTGRNIKLTAEDINTSTFGTGKAKTDITLGTDYEIVSYTNNVKAGTAKVTVRGLGEYCGTKTVTFKIKKKGFINFLGLQVKLF